MASERDLRPSPDDAAGGHARPIQAPGPAAIPVREESGPDAARVRRQAIFAVVSVALLMSSIDQTIVATALPTIDRDLHAPINWAAWTITIYSLGRVLVLPLAGRLSDHYGRRAIFLFSVALFTAGSLCCGLAGDIYLLVALRAVQAVGGAAFMPSATGVVADHFGSGRDRAVGLFTSIMPIGAIIGPVLGGLFVTYWSWRGIFLVNVPIGIALMLAGHRCIPHSPRGTREAARPDLIGMIELAVALLAAMLGIACLGSAGARFSSPLFLAAETAAVVALALFVRHTGRAPAPFIPSRLLHGAGFGVMNLINFLFGATALGFSALVPLYATERYGIASLNAGTLLTARAVGMIAVGGVAAFALRRTGYRLPMLAGFLATAAGLFAMAASPPGLSPYAWLSIAAAATGIGMGLSNPATNNASLQLAPHHAAAIAGLRGTFRQAGAITAISVTTAILARSADPGIAGAHVFAVFALILLATVPLLALVPEHRGAW
jgi:EmrB/QacA subfamily drug resistance transporter